MASVAVAVTAGANNGSSPPAPTMGAGSVDLRGSVKFGSGSSPAAGAQVIIALGSGFSGQGITPTAGVGIAVTPLNPGTAALGPWYAGFDSTGRLLTLFSTNAPTASQTGTTYQLSYIALG